MSSSGLDWQPLLQAWLRTRPHHEQGVLTELFSSTFPALFTWTKQNLRLCVPVLQVNLMAQVNQAASVSMARLKKSKSSLEAKFRKEM